MKRIALFLLIALVAVSSAEAQKVKRTKQKAWDNFEWYLLEQKGLYKGAAIDKEREVIPLSEGYQEIKYIGKGFFEARKNNNAALYDSRGKNIIPVTRGYTKIEIEYFKDYIYFKVFRTEHSTGLCDRNGQEIIPCMFYSIFISFGNNPSDHLILADSKRIFEYDGEEIILPMEYNGITPHANAGFIVYKGHSDKDIKAGYYDILRKEVIPIEYGYTDIRLGFDDSGNGLRFLRVYKGGKSYLKSTLRGICQIDGKPIIEPQDLEIPEDAKALQYEIRYNDNDGFYYNDKYEIKHFLGIKLDSRNQAVPYSNHPSGTTNRPIPQEPTEELTANNNTYNNTYNSGYNNTYTPPAQHKQQSSGNKGNNHTNQPKSSASSSSSAPSSSKPSSSSNRPSHNNTTASSFQQQKVKCGQCRGTGMTNCWSCNGKGTIRKSGIDKNGKQVFRNDRCTGCNGSGKRKCTVCNGKGVR